MSCLVSQIKPWRKRNILQISERHFVILELIDVKQSTYPLWIEWVEFRTNHSVKKCILGIWCPPKHWKWHELIDAFCWNDISRSFFPLMINFFNISSKEADLYIWHRKIHCTSNIPWNMLWKLKSQIDIIVYFFHLYIFHFKQNVCIYIIESWGKQICIIAKVDMLDQYPFLGQGRA